MATGLDYKSQEYEKSLRFIAFLSLCGKFPVTKNITENLLRLKLQTNFADLHICKLGWTNMTLSLSGSWNSTPLGSDGMSLGCWEEIYNLGTGDRD